MANTALQVFDNAGRCYSVEGEGNIDGAWVGGQAHGGGTEIDYDRLWSVGPGWHKLTIEVSESGTRGWYDDQPLPHTHPTLTNCCKVAFYIGWCYYGAACWDDFIAVYSLAKPDFNGDRTVNFTDFAYLARGYREANHTYDMDGDGSFTISDLALFTTDWTRIIPDLLGYQFVWSDEFDGIEIDYSKWTHEVGDHWYNNEIQSYTARPYNSVIENGNLVIIAREEQYGPNKYTSARLRSLSKADFRYGRMAARIKLPTGKGIWPAFWMLPTYQVYGGWPDSGEIDIMEAINQTNRIYGTIHFSNAQHQRVSSGGSYYAGGLNFADDFHVYAVEWEPNEIRWFVDDVMYFSETEWSSDSNPYPAPFDEEFHFIINVAIGGDWAGPPDESTVFPQRMLVDWVRVYQKNP